MFLLAHFGVKTAPSRAKSFYQANIPAALFVILLCSAIPYNAIKTDKKAKSRQDVLLGELNFARFGFQLVRPPFLLSLS